MVLSVVTVSYAETVPDESYTDAYSLVTQLGLIEDADENEDPDPRRSTSRPKSVLPRFFLNFFSYITFCGKTL